MVVLPHLENDFPNLASAGYDKTSDQTGGQLDDGSYNCIAWAAEDVHHKFWWPNIYGHWPFWIRRQETVRCFIWTFFWLGYVKCRHSRREFAFDKVVLYAIHKSGHPTTPPNHLRDFDDWIPTHMARQMPDGTWTSKCGTNEDITHFTLDALECHGPNTASYGTPVIYMKRLDPVSRMVRFIQRISVKLERRWRKP